MCILDFSKVLMYEFHFDHIKNKFGSNSRLFFTDTDSLMYEIKTEDDYEDFNNDREMFDFNNNKKILSLRFAPYHLNTKTMSKHAVTKLPFVIRYVPDQYKTQQMCDNVILENRGIFSRLLQESQDM